MSYFNRQRNHRLLKALPLLSARADDEAASRRAVVRRSSMSVESQSLSTAFATAAGCPVHENTNTTSAMAAGCPVQLDAAFGHAPYETYRELREAGPVQPVVLP